MEKSYTFSVFTEDTIGIRSRIYSIFTKRLLDIESITVSKSEIKNILRYTIVLKINETQVKKIIGQLEKLVDVLKAFVHEEKDIIHQEIALYKIKINGITSYDLEKIIRENHARILSVDQHFLILEKTGHENEIEALFEKLTPFGILGFAKSGRIALTKPMNELTNYLND